VISLFNFEFPTFPNIYQVSQAANKRETALVNDKRIQQGATPVGETSTITSRSLTGLVKNPV
jgi:hypothetical protein